MGIFNKNRMNILQKTQENLEMSQKNTEEMLKKFEQLSEMLEKDDRVRMLQKTQENLEMSQKNTEEILKRFELLPENAIKDDKLEILQKTQENQELFQKCVETLIEKIDRTELAEEEKELTSYEDKLRAAYALNLCMLSVSQIIDYNDVYILEQEYEMILNNLNIEQMPKDEALLNILKQILDTIAFFRIQEGDRKYFEKEYQQRAKNAIWSAIPNLSVIVASNNPIVVGMALISQVGIGYMNYRKEKAKIGLDKEKQEWQLQRSAIEQFNGLLRELFDTAWRLADKYDFPDKYRLTERQIKQYNEILMDADPVRRYERLESIKDKFEAYPPFWYYFGNTANEISRNYYFRDIDASQRYQQLARIHFETFQRYNTYRLLREDLISSACCLEYAELLDVDKDREKISELIGDAVNTSGDANDVLQLCALAYLRIGDARQAALLLKRIVNEDYNKVVNAQILSSIYVSEFISSRSDEVKFKYDLLKERVAPDYLFPMPKQGALADNDSLQREFISIQKSILLKKYAIVLEKIIEKYTIRFNQKMPLPYSEKEYPEYMYLDEAVYRQERIGIIEQGIKKRKYAKVYQETIRDANVFLEYQGILKEMLMSIWRLNCVGAENRQRLLNKLYEDIGNYQEEINEIQNMFLGEWNQEGFKHLLDYTFERFTRGFFEELVKIVKDYVNSLHSMPDFVGAESELRSFCMENDIEEPEALFNIKSDTDIQNKSDEIIPLELFGESVAEVGEMLRKKEEMKKLVLEKMDTVVEKKEKVKVFMEEDDISKYLQEEVKSPDEYTNKVFAVLDSQGGMWSDNTDLLFTVEGICVIQNKKEKCRAEYGTVDWNTVKHKELKIGNIAYDNNNVDLEKLFDIIKKIAECFPQSEKENTEIFGIRDILGYGCQMKVRDMRIQIERR